ncbi:MAG: tetratricopeptide repeat protein [Phycisphaerales bacterium]|nr:tetratricopeptide repeat protein [Phycisphaerales bacterium]
MDKTQKTRPDKADKPAEPSPGLGAAVRGTWQLPALGLATALLLAGVAAAVLIKPKPDYTGQLAEVARLIDREQYRQALELLNGRILPYLDAGALPKEFAPQFHLLRGRAIYLGQKEAGINLPVNHENIVAEYLDGEQAGAVLDARDTYFLGDTYIALGKLDRAKVRLEQLPESEHLRRGQLLKRMIDARMDVPAPDVVATLALLGEFLKDPELGISDKAWALARQGNLLVRQGYADEAIAKLLRSMPGMMQAGPVALGELYLLLGRAYLDRDAPIEAAKALEQAATLLPEADSRRGTAMVLLARIEADTRDGLEEARHKFAAVAEQYEDTPARLPALLGLAEVEAGLGDHEAALTAYQDLVHAMEEGRKHPDVSPAIVTRSLLDRHQDRLSSGDSGVSLRYAELAERLYPAGAAPPEVLLAIAESARAEAQGLLPTGDAASHLVDLRQLDPATRESARSHFVQAGQYFQRYAGAVIATDNDAYGRALWAAADSFDCAGDQDAAIPLFADYARGFPGDRRQPEAAFRMAQAQEARSDLETAQRVYRALLDGTYGPPGPYTDASYVPLARTLLANTAPEDDEEAENLLKSVVSGKIGGADSANYHDALVELARLHYRNKQYPDAIERLQEAVTRYPSDPDIDGLRYILADAGRLEAASIAEALRQPMPDDQKRALEETRAERLRTAQALFERVRESIRGMDPRRTDDLQRLQMRNATFYVGDCAFELGLYDEAIRRYDAAREAYPRDPASLVALVQIVNCYMAQGDLKRAATANERARRFYAGLPDDAWNDPNLPMSRADWQRWLDSLAQLAPPAGETAPDMPKKASAAAGEGQEGP